MSPLSPLILLSQASQNRTNLFRVIIQRRIRNSRQHLPPLHHRGRLPPLRTSDVQRHGHPVCRDFARLCCCIADPDPGLFLSLWQEVEGEKSI